MNKIKLPNRYNANIWLEYISKDLWQLKSDKEEDLDYMRFIFEKDNKTIYAVDPSGGPFLAVGSTLTQDDTTYLIKEIFHSGIIFRLEQLG